MAARRGPKAEIRNPAPADRAPDEPSEYVTAGELDESERVLRAALKRRAAQLQRKPGETREATVRRITAVVEAALDETDVVWWSEPRRVIIEHDEPPSVTTEPPNPAAGQLDVDDIERAPAAADKRPWLPLRARRHVGPIPPKSPAFGCLWFDTSATPVLRRFHPSKREWVVEPMDVSPIRVADAWGVPREPPDARLHRLALEAIPRRIDHANAHSPDGSGRAQRPLGVPVVRSPGRSARRVGRTHLRSAGKLPSIGDAASVIHT